MLVMDFSVVVGCFLVRVEKTGGWFWIGSGLGKDRL